jgi:hypothetical protein
LRDGEPRCVSVSLESGHTPCRERPRFVSGLGLDLVGHGGLSW